jgi:hypothetical protein
MVATTASILINDDSYDYDSFELLAFLTRNVITRYSESFLCKGATHRGLPRVSHRGALQSALPSALCHVDRFHPSTAQPTAARQPRTQSTTFRLRCATLKLATAAAELVVGAHRSAVALRGCMWHGWLWASDLLETPLSPVRNPRGRSSAYSRACFM